MCVAANQMKESDANLLFDYRNISTHIFAILSLYTCMFIPGRLILWIDNDFNKTRAAFGGNYSFFTRDLICISV